VSVVALVGLSLGFFARYDLDRERHARLRAELEHRGSGVAP
jgi:alkylated DNA repair dioxygenase AlkB